MNSVTLWSYGKRGALVFPFLVIGLFMSFPLHAGSNQVNSHKEIQPKPSSIEFSARIIWRKGGKTSKAQLFVKGDRYRIEHLGGLKTDLGFAGVTIVRLDKQKVWYVYSQRRLVLSVPATAMDILPLTVTLEDEVGRKLIGDAFVGKRLAQLYEVEVLLPSGRREKYYEWVDSKRQVLLKLLSQDRDWWVEYEHVVVSKQPDYYFETPLGYRTVEAEEAYQETG